MGMPYIYKALPKTLLIRFTLIITIPILIGQGLAIFLFYDRHWYNVSYYTSNLIANEIKSLLDNLDANTMVSNSGTTGEFLNLSYKFFPQETPYKKPLKVSEEITIFKNILDLKINKYNIVNVNKNNEIEVFLDLGNSIIKISFSSKLLINPTTYIFVLWLVLLTFILISISLFFVKNQVKSILSLASAADNFGSELKSIKEYKPSGAQEIRKAGIAFLKMRDRIKKQVSKKTKMLAMISHDLRTPLTRIKLQVEFMNNTEEKELLQQDIRSMQRMIDSYLAFAKGEEIEDFQEVNIISWIENLITDKWSNTNIELLTNKTIIKACIKQHSLERAISNLIDNAIKYATRVKISVYDLLSNLCIEIEDNGIGIKEKEKRLVFKPFYRSSKSRSLNESSNVGLGLTIAREIIREHHGSILLLNSKNLKGLLVRVKLPILKE